MGPEWARLQQGLRPQSHLEPPLPSCAQAQRPLVGSLTYLLLPLCVLGGNICPGLLSLSLGTCRSGTRHSLPLPSCLSGPATSCPCPTHPCCQASSPPFPDSLILTHSSPAWNRPWKIRVARDGLAFKKHPRLEGISWRDKRMQGPVPEQQLNLVNGKSQNTRFPGNNILDRGVAGGTPDAMPHWPSPATTTVCSLKWKDVEGCCEPAANSPVNYILLTGLFIYKIFKTHFTLPVARRQPGWGWDWCSEHDLFIWICSSGCCLPYGI